MRRGWKVVLYVWSGFWALIFFAATVPAKQGISNLESWADFLGLTGAARYLIHPQTDLLARILSGISLGLAFLYWTIRFYEMWQDRRVGNLDPDVTIYGEFIRRLRNK